MRTQETIPYRHELTHREDIKAARAQIFRLLNQPYPPHKETVNVECMTFEEWINAANFGAGQQEDAQSSGKVHGMIAVLAWARGEDPTEWAAAKYHMPVRRGEHIQGKLGRVPVIGIDHKGEPIVGCFKLDDRRRQIVNLYMHLPQLPRS